MSSSFSLNDLLTEAVSDIFMDTACFAKTVVLRRNNELDIDNVPVVLNRIDLDDAVMSNVKVDSRYAYIKSSAFDLWSNTEPETGDILIENQGTLDEIEWFLMEPFILTSDDVWRVVAVKDLRLIPKNQPVYGAFRVD